MPWAIYKQIVIIIKKAYIMINIQHSLWSISCGTSAIELKIGADMAIV
jgi:hypothetical protein